MERDGPQKQAAYQHTNMAFAEAFTLLLLLLTLYLLHITVKQGFSKTELTVLIEVFFC